MKTRHFLFYLMLLFPLEKIGAIELVDVELQLLIDISGSVNSSEYDLQMLGYKAAFESDTVQNAIINGTEGKIAVQMIMWSGSNQQQIMIDWTLIDSGTSADAFAATIATIARPFSGWTAIGSAISFAYPEFDSNAFQGTTQIIDISGDGTNNQGISPESGAADAMENGVDRINGVVITDSQAVIDEYSDNVVAGDGAFLLAPANFNDFQSAIENKIASEISNTAPTGVVYSVPTPATLWLFVIALVFIIFNNFIKKGE